MKDPVTGQVKTETITVNGPISLAETTTKGDVNPENLSRSFVVGIDESEDQTRLIHDRQRTNYTVDGFLQRRSLDRITERHHFAQRLLEPVLVFNPYAEVLTFPASTLKTRRDHEKFLRLINAICFLMIPRPARELSRSTRGRSPSNNFRTLADYEYIQLIKARSGLANQYRLSAHYSDLDFLTTILSPEDLTARIKAQPAAAGAAT